MDSRTPRIVWSRRFAKQYLRSNAALMGLIEGEVHNLIERWRTAKATWMRSYDRLAHLPDVLELEVGRANRLLTCWANDHFVLLDVGNHDVTSRYTRAKYAQDRFARESAPPQFWPAGRQGLGFFLHNPTRISELFGTELSPEWVYFLSEQQYGVTCQVFNSSWEAPGTKDPYHAFIVGGPGTGKTSILLTLLKDFVDLGIPARVMFPTRLLRTLTVVFPSSI